MNALTQPSEVYSRSTILILFVLMLVGSLSAQPADRPKPVIGSVSAAQGVPGQQITVVGTGFGDTNGKSKVLWLGTRPAVNIVSWNDTQIVAVVPLDATSGSIAVRRGDDYPDHPGKHQWSEPIAFSIASPSTPDNGIIVSDVKVYDDATLQQMLDSARARLANMQFLDQASIASRIGTIQGASLQQSGFALNVGGPPIPGVTTTANTGNTNTTLTQGNNTQSNSGNTVTTSSTGTNNQTSGSTNTSGGTTSAFQNTATTNNQLQVSGPSTVSTTSGSNQVQTVGPSTTTVTTLGQQNAVTPTLPTTTTFTLPSSFSPSASNVLNEQLELTYEVTGLAMLLEGSQSDHYMQVQIGDQRLFLVRERATIGVPVTLSPSKRYSNSVAEIILEITTPANNRVALPPAITAILPREKTYNVAAITDRSVSLGGGVVTQVLTAGANWLRGTKTFYVVQDQDTVALNLPPDPDRPTTTRVGWQIRPVLGQKTVRSGMRTLFVQLAFPTLGDEPNMATVRVITRWKKLDRNRNVVNPDPIEDSSVTLARDYNIPRFDVLPDIQQLDDPVDNGDGTVNVHVQSQNYLSGTVIRIGTAALAPGSPNTLFDRSNINFTVPAAIVATRPAYIVDRSGKYTELRNPLVAGSNEPQCLKISKVEVTPVNSANATVKVTADILTAVPTCSDGGATLKAINPVVIIGNRVFGYRDAPFQSVSDHDIVFVASLDLLRASPHVVVKRVFWGPRFEDGHDFSAPGTPIIDKAILAQKSGTNIEIALIGSFLKGLNPIIPAGAYIEDGATDTGAVLRIPVSSGDAKQIVLRAPSGDLLLVAMPDLSSDPVLQPHAPVKAARATTLTIQGSNIDDFDHVEFNKRELPSRLSADKKGIEVTLPAAALVPPKIELAVFFKRSKKPLTYALEVFDVQVGLPAQQIPSAPPK